MFRHATDMAMPLNIIYSKKLQTKQEIRKLYTETVNGKKYHKSQIVFYKKGQPQDFFTRTLT